MQNNPSPFLRLNWSDVAKGVAIAVITVVLGALQQGLSAHGFNFGEYNWVGILNTAGSAGVAYLVKNLLSTQDGKVMGIVG